jgi:hypothetical protein
MARPEARIWRRNGPARAVFSGGSGGPDWKRVLHADQDRSLPGCPITDCRKRLYTSFLQAETPTVAAARAGFSVATAYRIGAFAGERPGLRSVAIFRQNPARHPELGTGFRRMLEGRIRTRRAPNGAERDVIFRQEPSPGRLATFRRKNTGCKPLI